MAVGAFLDEMPKVVGDLREAIAAGGIKEAASHAHKIKGSAANFGAKRLYAISSRMEELGGKGGIEQVAEILPVLEKELEELEKVMGKERGEGK